VIFISLFFYLKSYPKTGLLYEGKENIKTPTIEAG
jgi:hypothetical protein